jgi:ABC-type lipoprotein export system ATPase subunit
MSLIELDQVSKRYRSAQRERIVLSDVSLQVQAGELVMVWGARRSGRTTLLRIAAGIEQPDRGSVRFEGKDLAEEGEHTLGQGIGYVAKTLRAAEEQGVLEQIASVLLARGVGVARAREHARRALARAGAERCAAMKVSELGGGENLRVAIARTLALEPKLIVIDEPAATVEITERDEILGLLRGIAGEGAAVLASTGEPDQLAAAHRALTLSDGALKGPSTREPGTVLELKRRSA